MYQISIFNNNIETIIHYPSDNQNDPHLNKLPLKEGLSVVDTLSFSLYPNNPGFNSVFELTTIIKAIDVRDNTNRYTGRVLDVSDKMDNSGQIYKEVTCEGALSFLNDTKQRGNSFITYDVPTFLNQILGIHNSKVESGKQIQVGNVDISSTVIHTCNFKTTLAEILLVRDEIGGNIRVRETNGTLYLDWLTSFSSNEIEVRLGVNMKDMVISKDVTSLGTRIIPLGANNLTIETVNNGIDYIDDVNARNSYGVIEKTVEYKDIEDATTLLNTCISDLHTHTQPSYLLESSALDLSYITGNKTEQFALGINLHLINEHMGVDDIYSIVQIDLDLLRPYNPNLTIANKPITLTNTLADLRNSSIQNDGVYNNVQIGRSFGIRAVKSNGKTITTLNATDGIRIQTDRGHGLVDSFYVDINGNLKINYYDEITGELRTGLDLTDTKVSAVVSSPDGGSSWELNKNAFIIAFNKAGSGYTEISENGITIYDGRFKIKKGTDTVFYVNTSGRCTADGGFVVNDGGADTSMDANGVHITNASGQTASLGVSDIGRFFTPGSMEIDEGLDVNGFLHANGTMYMFGSVHIWNDDGHGNLSVDEDVNVGSDLNVSNNITVDGTTYTTDLDTSGSKNCLQRTLSYGDRRINALETCEYYFGDKGFGIAKEDTVVITFDDIFLECVNTNTNYHVNTQVYNNKKPITYIEKFPTYCIVHCEIGTEFSWSIEVKRIGYENIRLQQKVFEDEYKINTNSNTYYSDIKTVDNSNMENYLLETDIDTENYLMEVIK